MNRAKWIIKVLSESSRQELPEVYKEWLNDNVKSRNITVCVEDCILERIDWSYEDRGLIFVQDGKELWIRKMLMQANQP